MDDRGVSAIVSYALILGIVALLTSALFAGFAPFVTNQQQDAVHSTLAVFGTGVAGDIDSADRLATRAGENGTVELRTQLPDRVGGSTYEIEMNNKTDTNGIDAYDYEIKLRSTNPETSARISVRSQRPIETEPDVLDGGTLKITYDADEDKLVMRNG